MDLTQCTPGQRETVLTLDEPLMVSAGAGSGKTFTLTQRIVCALLPGAGGSPAPLDSIESVLAITFTKKAAAELRSRIKATLRAEGLEEQALLADGAWITTIHGMAARLLRENALEVGLDPAFQMVGEAEAQELLQQAVDRVVRRIEDGGHPEVAALLGKRSLFGRGSFARGVVDDALELLHRAEAMPGGLGGVRFLPEALSPAAALRALYEQGCAFQEVVTAWDEPSKREQPAVDAIGPALEGALAWLGDASQASLAFDDQAFDADRFRRAFFAFPPTTATFGAKRDEAAFFEGYRAEYVRLADEVEGALGQRDARAILAVARLVDEEFRALKGPSRLDSGDLLRRCLEALRDHGVIAERYRRRFRLIMVDEFQDTDKVQVEVIRMLAAPDGRNICVVGDAQQSIYRFRGADVNVFFDYRDALRATDPRAHFPQLNSNFRSHGDVLAAVEKVFSQPEAFGADFLRLEAAGKVNREADPAFEAQPRVALDVVHYQRGSARAAGVPKDAAVAMAAARVAEHFARLRDEHGASPSSMALLLGTTSNAPTYIAALRQVGLESVMVSGSVFAKAAEPQVVSALLRYATNTQDEPALLAALFSPLFALSDDALLALAYAVGDPEGARHRPFARAFLQEGSTDGCGLPEADERAIAVARRLLRRFVRTARGGRPAAALRALLAGSGLLAYDQGRGADGLASGGNYAKALALVEGLAREATGIAGLSAAYDGALAASKEAPGVLAASSSEFVRIMTVHGSKGLQFDHVVVAEVKTGQVRGGSFFAENQGDVTFAMACGSQAEGPKATWEKLRKLPVEDPVELAPAEARTPGELLRAVQGFAKGQERAEAQRLLYVAMTRAVRSLCLSYVTSSKPESSYAGDGIFAEVNRAFGWEVSGTDGVELCSYGGSAPARVSWTCLTAERLAEGADGGEAPAEPCGGASPAAEAGDEGPAARKPQGLSGGWPAAADGRSVVAVPAYPEPVPTVPRPWAPLRQDVRSYSSLAHSYDLEAYAVAPALGEDAAAPEGPLPAREEPEDATALGTAFHHLAQQAIIACAASERPRRLRCPAPEAVEAQVRQGHLTEGQQERLSAALSRWFGSALAERFAACATVAAEVPFMVTVEGDGSKGTLYLEGEIDGLGDEGDGRALLIDYKTGGSAGESAEALHAKHLQQAQCYAYALLGYGFAEVEARFIRVEQPDPCDPAQPQAVAYRFAEVDRPALAEAIYAAFE